MLTLLSMEKQMVECNLSVHPGLRGVCVCPSCAPRLLVLCSGVVPGFTLVWMGVGWVGGYPPWDRMGLMGLGTMYRRLDALSTGNPGC